MGSLRFWMTRPEGTGQDLIAACADAGIDVVQLPLMDILPVEDVATAARLVMDLDHYSQVVFISANAVRFGMDLIEDYWPQLPVQVAFYAIGAATAKALQHRGVDVLAADGAMNSEALLQLPGLQAGPDLRKVLIMRGHGGRETLADTLRSRGARVDYCELYQRREPSYPVGIMATLLDEIQVNCWLASSAETLHNGLNIAPNGLRQRLCELPVIVPGERVALLAQRAGCQRVVIAENAGCDAVMRALKSLT